VTFSTLSISKHPQHLQGIERKVVVLLEGRERGERGRLHVYEED
jgi:hypothetical protein